MKFKLLAIAAVMAASGVANATPIDNGAAGNGGLFFTAWDANNSYTLNLNTTIDAFESAVAGSGLIDLSWTADANFTSFLGGADLASLKWNVLATDVQGARRVLETFVGPTATASNADVVRASASNLLNSVNDTNLKLTVDDSATYAVGSAGYAGRYPAVINAGQGTMPFVNAGSLSNSSYATGLNFMRINAGATGIAKAIHTTYADNGVGVAVYLDGSNALHISAVAPVTPVPEPENIAMLMAGLGLMGAIARRRNKKSA